MKSAEWQSGLAALCTADAHPLSNLANASALLFQSLSDINWAGFYLLDRGALWLGPFAGKPACVRIAPGRGVCGTAFLRNETLVVPDVHAFAGHIACDAASSARRSASPKRDKSGLSTSSTPMGRPSSRSGTTISEREAAARRLESCCDWKRLGYNLGREA